MYSYLRLNLFFKYIYRSSVPDIIEMGSLRSFKEENESKNMGLMDVQTLREKWTQESIDLDKKLSSKLSIVDKQTIISINDTQINSNSNNSKLSNNKSNDNLLANNNNKNIKKKEEIISPKSKLIDSGYSDLYVDDLKNESKKHGCCYWLFCCCCCCCNDKKQSK